MKGISEQAEPIAVVGMACRFPGANNPEEFWRLISSGTDAISDVGTERWDIGCFDHSSAVANAESSTRRGGFVDAIDQFDPYFFNITPREAIRMDPQQRMLLEVAWEALEGHGQNVDKLAGSQTGVFVGMMSAEYSSKWSSETDNFDVYDVPGNTFSIASNRLSYQFDFCGPSMTIDTACSSSLVTTHLACQSLRNHECDMALSGGVNAVISPYATVKYYQMGMLSPDARCKTFDTSANGYVRADGCGVIVLKRLSDAISAGDNILALIRGSAINQNGRGEGLTAPNGAAQQAVIRSALKNAGVQPADIAYVEAHGTGTRLGDPTEAKALEAVLAQGRESTDPCFLGSVKTNIGHAESAAGIAGMIKAVLCLCHEQIPPHLHLIELNPSLKSLLGTFQIPTKINSWARGSRARYAAINSFGFGGANAHVIVEEGPAEVERHSAHERSGQILSLSAQSETALSALALRFADHVDANPTLSLAQVCYSANVGRRMFSQRLAVCADTLPGLSEALRQAASGERMPGVWTGEAQAGCAPKLVFLFTGQGSQYVGMARELYESQARFRSILDRCSHYLEPHLEGGRLLDYLYPGTETDSRLDETWLTQPALFAVEYALAQLWISWGVKPDALLGHSVGEYVAACIAGVFTLEEGLGLIAARGRLMNALPSGGGMAAVMAGAEQVEALLRSQGGRLQVAAYNGPELVTISGRREELDALYAALSSRGIQYQPLSVSHAFHSHLMEPMLESYREVLEQVEFRAARIPVMGNVRGDWWGEGEAGVEYWLEQIRSPVQFEQGMRALSEAGYGAYVEVGPKATLLGMSRAWLAAQSVCVPSLLQGSGVWETLLPSLSQLYTSGVQVDWQGYEQDYVNEGSRRRIPLPTYPFERQRCWYEEDRRPKAVKTGAEVARSLPEPPPKHQTEFHPLLDEVEEELAGDGSVHRKIFTYEQEIINQHRVNQNALLPGVAYLEMAIAAARRGSGAVPTELCNITIAAPLVVDEGGAIEASVLLQPTAADSTVEFRVSSKSAEGESASDRLHATGEIRRSALSAIPGSLEVDSITNRCSAEMNKKDIYKLYHDLGIDYQDYFRSIEWMKVSEGEGLALIRLPQSLDTDRAYHLHPVIMDGAMQAMGAFYSRLGMSSTYVPFAINRIHIYRQPPDSVYCHVEPVLAGELAVSARELLHANLVLCDEQGHVLVVMEGVCLKKLPQNGLTDKRQDMVEGGRSQTQLLFQPSWRSSPIGAATEWQSRKWLVLMDTYGVGASLIYQLQRKGDQCIPIEIGQEYSFDGAGYCIDPSKEEHYQRLAHDLEQRECLPSGVIHLWRCDGPSLGSDDIAELKDRLDLGVYSLFFLTRSLMASAKQNVQFMVVTSYGQPVEGDGDEYIQPDKGALWGLSKVLPREYSRIHCKGVDLETRGYTVTQLAKQIIDELSARPAETHFESWVVYRGGRRLVSTLIPVDENRGDLNELPLREGGVYLITGGQGGVGLEIAKFIAGQVQARFVLVNRSPLDGKRHPDRVEGIRALEALGSEVAAEACDVADVDSMRKLIKRAVERWGGLDGVVHSAGVLHDGLIPVLDTENFSKVLHPKVYGSWVLDQVTYEYRPDFFLICSSMITLLTPPGQCNHVAACGFEDSFAAYRSARRKLRTIAINWGLWGETGVVSSASYQKSLKAKGLHAMTNAEGVRGLSWSLRSDLSRVVCGGVEVSVTDKDQDYKLPASAFSASDSLQQQSESSKSSRAVCGDMEIRESDKHQEYTLSVDEFSAQGSAEVGSDGDVFERVLGVLKNRLPDLVYSSGVAGRTKIPIDTPLAEVSNAYILGALRQLGWKERLGDRFTSSELMRDLQIAPQHERYFVHLLGLLAEDGVLRRHEMFWEIAAVHPKVDAENIGKNLLEDYPEHHAELVLFLRCVGSLADSLRGNSEALQLLFPDGSLDISREFYTTSPFSVFCNRVAQCAMCYISRASDSEQPLSILEVGAGTGGTTAYLLPALDPANTRYVFTDLSNFFLNKAADTFSQYPFVDYRILNAEQDPAQQDQELDRYDVVVAAHVLHATQDLRETVANIRKLMAPGAILILLESFESQRLLDLIFGSTGGWWRFSDLDLRPQHALISYDKWKSLLLEQGFKHVEAIYPEGGVAVNQAVILAQATDTVAQDQRYVGEQATPKLNTEQNSISAAAAAVDLSKGEAAGTDSGRVQRWVQTQVVDQIAESLRVPVERIQPERNFSELGVDSLVGVEIIGALKQTLKLSLGPTLLFEYPTVISLSHYLVEEFGEQLAATAGNEAGILVQSPSVQDQPKHETVADVDTPETQRRPDQDVRQWVQTQVVDQIAESLRVPVERVQPERNFSELGVDSLVGVEIIGALKQTLKLSLGPTLLFEYPTVVALSQHLVEEFGAQLAASTGTEAGDTVPPSGTQDRSPPVAVTAAAESDSAAQYGEDIQRWVQAQVVDQIAESLRVPVERIQPERKFSELGVDSLVGVEIIGALKQTLKLSLGPTLLFEYPTVVALSQYLVEEFGAALTVLSGVAISATGERSVSGGGAGQEVIHDGLSPEELLRRYEALPPDYRGLVDRAVSASEANTLILRYSSSER